MITSYGEWRSWQSASDGYLKTSTGEYFRAGQQVVTTIDAHIGNVACYGNVKITATFTYQEKALPAELQRYCCCTTLL